MTKDEAQREALRRWREMPIMNRLTHKQATEFAEAIAPSLDFHTMGHKTRIIQAWLVRDIEEREGILRELAAKKGTP